jgi:hypothetical protein
MELEGSSLPPASSSAMDGSAEVGTTPGDVETTSVLPPFERLAPNQSDSDSEETDFGDGVDFWISNTPTDLNIQHDSDILQKQNLPLDRLIGTRYDSAYDSDVGRSRMRPGRHGVAKCDRCRMAQKFVGPESVVYITDCFSARPLLTRILMAHASFAARLGMQSNAAEESLRLLQNTMNVIDSLIV